MAVVLDDNGLQQMGFFDPMGPFMQDFFKFGTMQTAVWLAAGRGNGSSLVSGWIYTGLGLMVYYKLVQPYLVPQSGPDNVAYTDHQKAAALEVLNDAARIKAQAMAFVTHLPSGDVPSTQP